MEIKRSQALSNGSSMVLALYAGLSPDQAQQYVKQRGEAEGWYVGSGKDNFTGKIVSAEAVLTDGKRAKVSGQLAFDADNKVTGFRTVGGKYLKAGSWNILNDDVSNNNSGLAGSSAFIDSAN